MAGKFPMTTDDMLALSRDYHFSKETVKFWNSQIHTSPDQYGLFIESCDNWSRTKRIYSVKSFDPNKGVAWTLSNFSDEEFKSLNKARSFLKKVEDALDAIDCFREKEILNKFSHIEPDYTCPTGVWQVLSIDGEHFQINTNNFERFISN